MTYVNRWERYYIGLTDPAPYSDTVTYEMGAAYLASCGVVEDWGCGKGWFKTLLPETCLYVGVDGTETPFADRVVDLTEYESSVEGIFMRHVLEHNPEWGKVLDNALASFTEKMVLVIFTPFAKDTNAIAHNELLDVPDISFRKDDITSRFGDITWRMEEVATKSQYDVEYVFYLSKENADD